MIEPRVRMCTDQQSGPQLHIMSECAQRPQMCADHAHATAFVFATQYIRACAHAHTHIKARLDRLEPLVQLHSLNTYI